MILRTILFVFSCVCSIPAEKCQMTRWGSWSACSHTCGGGVRERRCYLSWYVQLQSESCGETCNMGGQFTKEPFGCQCPPHRTGRCCDDIKDECSLGHCDHYCNSTGASFVCSCRSGYTLDADGTTCNDNNECLSNVSKCEHICINTPGSYRCACRSGYQLDTTGYTCIVSHSKGQTARLTCSITNAIPQWWSPSGKAINFSGSSVVINSFPHRDRFSITPAGVLVIHALNQDDVGQYTCSFPGSRNETINLLVDSAPYPTQKDSPYPTQNQYNTQYNTQYGSGPAPATSTVVVQQPSAFVVGLQFRDTPMRINCQFCHADVITATHYEVGTLTWVMCFLIGIVGFILCCWIPFCINACKDVVHTCPQCRQVLGRYNKM